jgi:hypothetical protein
MTADYDLPLPPPEDVPAGEGTVVFARVPGFPLYLAGDDGSVWSKWSGKWERLKPFVHWGSGHLRVNLSVAHNPGKKRPTYLHNVILWAFVGPEPFAGAEGLHVNGDKFDCRLANLRWGTRGDNNRDRTRHKAQFD